MILLAEAKALKINIFQAAEAGVATENRRRLASTRFGSAGQRPQLPPLVTSWQH